MQIWTPQNKWTGGSIYLQAIMPKQTPCQDFDTFFGDILDILIARCKDSRQFSKFALNKGIFNPFLLSSTKIRAFKVPVHRGLGL